MNKYDLFDILFTVVLIIFSIVFTKWMFNTVVASDLPNWLKYMLLR